MQQQENWQLRNPISSTESVNFSNTESNLLGKLLQIQPIGKRMNESTFKKKVSCMYETILLKFMNWRRHVA